MEPIKSNVYFGKLASLRFFAALLVVGSHLTLFEYTKNPVVLFVDRDVLSRGFIGVSIFYVLSGFVISLANDRWKDWKQYLIGRVARIYPTHLLVTVILFAVPLYVLVTHLDRPHAMFDLFANLTLMQAWCPQNHAVFALNSVSWSLSVEIFFYVTFIFLRKLSDRFIYTLAALGYLAVLVCEISLRGDARQLTHWAFYVFPISRLPEFLLGMSLFRLYKGGVLQRLQLPRVDFLVLFGLMLVTAATLRIFGLDELFFYSSLPALFGVALIVMLLVEDTSSYMNHRFLVLLGESSFVLYLIHRPIVRYPLSYRLQMGWGYGVVFALCMVVLAIGLSVVAHVYVESNATKYTKRGLLYLFVKKIGDE